MSKSCPGSISFNLDIDIPESMYLIYSDNNLIRQILERLIGNSFKYTGRGNVDFGCFFNEKKESYDFFVKDNGIGISTENQKEIFEPFHQLNPMIKGVGIGLTICRSHASLLRSHLKVESELGKGSTFRFRVKASK